MTYDPEMDEPRFSKRECQEFIKEALGMAVDRTVEKIMKILRGQDPEDWQLDMFYPPGAICQHAGKYWRCEKRTASEPSPFNTAWCAVKRYERTLES